MQSGVTLDTAPKDVAPLCFGSFQHEEQVPVSCGVEVADTEQVELAEQGITVDPTLAVDVLLKKTTK